jgi:hypothetical protein
MDIVICRKTPPAYMRRNRGGGWEDLGPAAPSRKGYCISCGRPLMRGKRGPMPKYCGTACRQAESRWRRGIISIWEVSPERFEGAKRTWLKDRTTGRVDLVWRSIHPFMKTDGTPLSMVPSAPGDDDDGAMDVDAITEHRTAEVAS